MKKLVSLLLMCGFFLVLEFPVYAENGILEGSKNQEESLASINGEEISGICGEQGDNLSWVLNDSGTLTISGNGKMENYSSLTATPWYPESERIINVVIEDGVTSIGWSAFEACDNLESIVVPESVVNVGSGAFSLNNHIQTAGPLGSGCDYEFGWQNEIPAEAFGSCRNLTSVIIPEEIKSIGDYAFAKCQNLTSVTIPESTISLGMGIFDACSNLTKIVIPEGVEKIEGWAFFGCSSMTGIVIPQGVTSIGYEAFYGCDSLTDVYYGGTKTQWNNISIAEYNTELTSATIHYAVDSGESPSTPPSTSDSSASGGSSGGGGGCYVATAVYGSYDCPEVWTLRRYRDYELAQTAGGRAFIKTYYAVSPTIVEYFGDEAWFQQIWRGPLDKIVANLQAKGYESTPYEDIAW